MKISVVALSLSFLAHPSVASAFQPQRFAYGELQDDQAFDRVKASFLEALTNVGMVSVSGIPDMRKQELLSSIHECTMASKATLEHVFPDGTRRRTMATHTVPGPGGTQKIHHGDAQACDMFSKASKPFREMVAEATNVFATRLSSVLNHQDKDTPLLSTRDRAYSFHSLDSIVEHGEHLEHFHSYQTSKEQSEEDTVKMHTDQGLFIAFTPGLMMDSSSKASSLSGGFFIGQQDGSTVEVEFTKEDDLVFMLGDGVNQYVNPKLDGMSSLRATPHALTMPKHSAEEARVWYGRMVLPPADAVHPQHKDKTFAELRQEMIDASLSGNDQDSLLAGCSNHMVARQLEETTCEEGSGTLYCWHRCMSLEEHGVSDAICAERGLDLVCTNPRGQRYTGGHGDYFPGCIDNVTAEDVTPYPTLPDYPRDDTNCGDDLYRDFVASVQLENEFDLGKGAVFQWSIENGEVNGRLAFNGIFGYLAMGVANVGGPKNGMHGATIIMALPGDKYSAVDGLDLTMDPTVQEYVIDPNKAKSAFRHWMTPVSSIERDISTYAVESTDCFTAITFKTDSIDDKMFNLTGSDELLWAANAVDFYAGYHGPTRGRFAINWATGEGTLDGEVPPGETETSGALPSVGAFFGMGVAVAAMFYL